MPPKKMTAKAKGRKKKVPEDDADAPEIPPPPSPSEEPEEPVEVGETDKDGSSDEDEEEDASKSKVPQLTPEQEQELAEFFEENPLFYDKSRSDFKNSKKKDRLLQDKSDQIKLSVADIKLWYRSQRTILGKIHKTKSGQKRCQLTARQKWVKTNLGFLTQHIVHRAQGSQLGKLPDDDDDNSEPSSSVTQPTTKRRKKKDVDAALLEFLEKTDKQTGELTTKVDAVISEGTDEKRAWVEWMLQALRPLPRNIWRDFTKEAFSLIMKYQERAETEQGNQGFAPQHMQQQVRPLTPQMSMPPRPASFLAQWPQDNTQMHHQMYSHTYHPAPYTVQPSTSQAANTSRGSAGSFNLSDLIPQTPSGPSTSQQPAATQSSDILAAAARVLSDDNI